MIFEVDGDVFGFRNDVGESEAAWHKRGVGGFDAGLHGGDAKREVWHIEIHKIDNCK